MLQEEMFRLRGAGKAHKPLIVEEVGFYKSVMLPRPAVKDVESVERWHGQGILGFSSLAPRPEC